MTTHEILRDRAILRVTRDILDVSLSILKMGPLYLRDSGFLDFMLSITLLTILQFIYILHTRIAWAASDMPAI